MREITESPAVEPLAPEAAGADVAVTIDDAITSRHSVRAFTDQPVSREQVAHLLEVARWAPSATNTQPWKVHVLVGEARETLSRALLARFNGEVEFTPNPDYEYYPEEWREPYIARRRACGWGLYGVLGIKKGEREKSHRQHARNFAFFDAPVGLIFCIDESFRLGGWLDVGMFMQNIMVAARGQGLHTCPQAAFAGFAPVIREHLNVPEHESVICGMAIGYKDPSVPENQWRTDREPLEEFVQWHGI